MKVLRLLLCVLLLLGSMAGLYVFWQYRTLNPTTDDAYVHAHIVQIAPRVTAPVIALHVAENQYVRAGEPLFELDPALFQATLDSARARLDLAAQATGASGAGVRAASALLRERQVAADNAGRTLARVQSLARQKLVPQAGHDDALAAYSQALAAVDSARAELERAREALGITGPENAALRTATAAVQRAELELSYTRLLAPAAGWISNITLRVGALAEAGRPQFALVEAGDWWVEANFRETDLERIRPGHPARIEIDMYPDVMLQGRVASLGAGSGAVFSLLPPENATGNWVKVTQRFPVRISLATLPPDPAMPLRVGASATVTVDTSVTP